MLALSVGIPRFAAALTALLGGVACGGVTALGTESDGSPPLDGGDATTDDAKLEHDASGDATTDDACATVGVGAGVESCCSGKLCRGECSPFDECVCHGSGAVGGCPAGAACCKNPWFKPHTPTCNAPQDCAPD